MLRKNFILAAAAALTLTASPTLAQQQQPPRSFFSEVVTPGTFSVYGNAKDASINRNPTCFIENRWRDGSIFQLSLDLGTNEMWIYFKNLSWNIGDAPAEYTGNLTFRKNGRVVDGAPIFYDLVNKNTIVLRNINKELFLKSFSENDLMVFVMPGNISNAELSLLGSATALETLRQCVRRSEQTDLGNVEPESPSNRT